MNIYTMTQMELDNMYINLGANNGIEKIVNKKKNGRLPVN